MSVFKIIKRENKRVELDIEAKNSQISLRQLWKQYKNRKGGKEAKVYKLAVYILSSIAIVAWGFVLFPLVMKFNLFEKHRNPILFEIKVLNQEGHPIAGAKVIHNKKKLGVTDSFGEWMRFLPLPKGSSIMLSFEKRQNNKLFMAQKNLVIPMKEPVEGDFVVKSQVSLKEVLIETSLAPGAIPEEVRAGGQVADSKQSDYRSIWFSLLNKSKNLNAKETVLKNRLIPALQRESLAQGLVLSSKSRWQVGLSHIEASRDAAFPGIIRVVGRRLGKESKIDFLRNYTGDSLNTAGKILLTLKRHIPKSYRVYKGSHENWYVKEDPIAFWQYPVASWLRDRQGKLWQLLVNSGGALNERVKVLHKGKPLCEMGQISCLLKQSYLIRDPVRQDWQLVKIRSFTKKRNISLFFGGIKAHLQSKGNWRVWAKSRSKAYLSIVQDRSLIYRKLFDLSKKDTLTIAIPSQIIGRK